MPKIHFNTMTGELWGFAVFPIFSETDAIYTSVREQHTLQTQQERISCSLQ